MPLQWTIIDKVKKRETCFGWDITGRVLWSYNSALTIHAQVYISFPGTPPDTLCSSALKFIAYESTGKDKKGMKGVVEIGISDEQANNKDFRSWIVRGCGGELVCNGTSGHILFRNLTLWEKKTEGESLAATNFYIYKKHTTVKTIYPLQYFAFDKIFMPNLGRDVMRPKFFLVSIKDAAVCAPKTISPTQSSSNNNPTTNEACDPPIVNIPKQNALDYPNHPTFAEACNLPKTETHISGYKKPHENIGKTRNKVNAKGKGNSLCIMETHNPLLQTRGSLTLYKKSPTIDWISRSPSDTNNPGGLDYIEKEENNHYWNKPITSFHKAPYPRKVKNHWFPPNSSYQLPLQIPIIPQSPTNQKTHWIPPYSRLQSPSNSTIPMDEKAPLSNNCFSNVGIQFGRGLANLGQSCWFNAILQCMFTWETLTKELMEGQSGSGHDPNSKAIKEMAFLYRRLIHSHNSQGWVNPKLCYEALKKTQFWGNLNLCSQEHVKGYAGEDANEGFDAIYTLLTSKIPTLKMDTIYYDHTIVICIACNYTRYAQGGIVQASMTPPLVLTVPMKKGGLVTSLEELIEEYFKEQYTGNTVCCRCKSKGKTMQKTELGRTPKYLVLSLKRPGAHIKHTPIKVPLELSLEPYVHSDNLQQSHLYTLKGAAKHVGDITKGHWKACSIKNNQWVEYNDTLVSPVSKSYVCLELNPDLLFLEKLPKDLRR